MNIEKLKEVVALSQKLGHLFLATADKKGLPHIAAAQSLDMDKDGRLVMRYWFCPESVENIYANSNVSIVVWDKDSDKGFQLTGKAEDVIEVGMLDGYAKDIEKKPLPQVQRQLSIRVDNIIEFTHMPHTDVEK